MRTRTFLSAIAAALLLLPLLSEARPPLMVEIDVYSGRPNPRFLLEADGEKESGDKKPGQKASDEKERASAEKILKACSGDDLVRKEPVAYPEQLGYRGMRILYQVGQDTYRPVSAVYKGTLRLSGKNAALLCGAGAGGAEDAHYRDDDKGLEKTLMGVALKKGAIPKPVFDRLMKDIEAP